MAVKVDCISGMTVEIQTMLSHEISQIGWMKGGQQWKETRFQEKQERIGLDRMRN